MTEKTTGTGFDGLKAHKSDHSLDLERARAAKKTASDGRTTAKTSVPGNPQPPSSPSPSAANPSRQPAQAPPPASSSSGGWWALGGLGAIVVFGIALRDSPSSSSSSALAQVSAEALAAADAVAAAESTVQPIEAHVVAEQANVRSEPSTRGAVVTALPRMQSVYVIGKEGTWSQVVTGSGANSVQGYISSRLLFEGSAQGARAVVCDVANSSTPYNGEVLTRSGYGNNSLAVNAGGSDVLIKLRQGGSTALAFYVRNGQRGVVEDVPDGTYQVMFATGDGFSRKCLEFVNSMSVSADPTPATFETRITSDGYNQYTQSSAAEYTLTRQTGGNFTPSTLEQSAFRE
nr:SH3 domain-containing protein [Luteimonas sp. MC1825]